MGKGEKQKIMVRKLHFDWSDLPLLVENDISLREIGRRKGCSHDAVKKAIVRMDIPYFFDKSKQMKKIAKDRNYSKIFSREITQRVDVVCDYCGEHYRQLESRLRYEHHFCSNHCRASWCGQKNANDLDLKIRQSNTAIKNGNKPPLLKGVNHPKWKGGITEQNKIDRSCQKYVEWKRNVFMKDNYTCQICGIRGGRLSAHHIKVWAEYPELRYDVNNGQCLCYDCHMELHGLKKKTA